MNAGSIEARDKLTQHRRRSKKNRGCFLTGVPLAALFGYQALPNLMATDFQVADGATLTNKYLDLETFASSWIYMWG